ncbi:hypothetical protein ACIRQF_30840 [Streptomyces sp. NPDC101191]|uniref:hypothetical protein n=1 Tax=Streptomyces sp. NPDC101191 TaxID=3366126 RepID=UPI00381F58C8
MFTMLAAPAAQIGTSGKILAGVGSGAIAVALLLILILGVKGKGGRKLNSGQAFWLAFFFVALCTVTGAAWNILPDTIGIAGEGAADGLSGAGLGQFGVAGVALIVLVLYLYLSISPALGAWMGLVLSGLCTAAGGIAAILPTIIASIARAILIKTGAA